MDKPKFRASSVFHLMTEPRAKSDKEAGNLSEGAKTHCVDTWVRWKFDRNEEIFSKYLEKGTSVEEDSITLYAMHTGVFFTKNESRLSNDWIQGTPDLFIGKSIDEAEVIIDLKSSWTVYQFHRARMGEVKDAYYWQLQAYMWLTGAQKAKLAYCLVNATDDLIRDELRKAQYALRLQLGDETPEYIERAKNIERLHIYDLAGFRKRYPNFDLYSPLHEWKYDIAPSERIHIFEIDRNDGDIARMKSKIIKAWEYMGTL